ncbi:MAG: hypothetical protein WC472_03515 [Candidatus Paceibacterota bacterium]
MEFSKCKPKILLIITVGFFGIVFYSFCFAEEPGVCGTANGKEYSYAIKSYGSDTQCANGGIPSSTAFPALGSSTSWTCNGSSPTCSAKSFVPVPDCYGAITTLPSGNIDIDFYCKGLNYNPSSAEKIWMINGIVGGPSNFSYSNLNYDKPTSEYHRTGATFGNFPPTSCMLVAYASYYPFQTGVGIIKDPDPAKYSEIIVCPYSGACGTANLKTYPSATTSYGTDTQCASGIPTNTAFPEKGKSVTWICNGENTGLPSSTCIASRSAISPKWIEQ